MHTLALLCYSTAMFSIGWAVSMRFTDYNTPRWHSDSRWFVVMIPAFAGFFLFDWLGGLALPPSPRNSASVAVAHLIGLGLAVVVYVLVAWSKPGFLGARPYSRAPPPEPPAQAPKSTRDWLLSDVRNLPENLRKRKDPNP